jgi:chaperonin GroEL (HSP60 family)
VLRSGYREACNIAQERLEAVAVDHSAEPDAFRNDLLNIARTTLSSKILTQVRFVRLIHSCTATQVAHIVACPLSGAVHLPTTAESPSA